MTGIDRLRTLAGEWDAWGLGGTLSEIADEVERERAEDCCQMGLDCGTVWRVVADMERHILGHEGMEDSPVARWARELRGALKTDEVVLKGYEDDWHVHADKLTHTKPEIDSWERWRSDLESAALGYAQDAYHGLETSIDFDGFVRRAKALAERERGE